MSTLMKVTVLCDGVRRPPRESRGLGLADMLPEAVLSKVKDMLGSCDFERGADLGQDDDEATALEDEANARGDGHQ